MWIKQIYSNNKMRNFHYLIACKETGRALAIDPYEADLCYQIAKEEGLEITHILNTHEHWDHIGGNARLIELTGAKVMAHENAHIPHKDIVVQPEDRIRVGNTVELKALHTPGHTRCHLCLLAEGEQRALFCGDTLFNAGCGHCLSEGGDPESLYNSFNEQIFNLPDDTVVYPGHDYIENNLLFTLEREPSNQKAAELVDYFKKSHYDPINPYVSTIGIEKMINTFFRLNNREIIERLRNIYPQLSEKPSEKEVFLAVRACRDEW